VDSCPELKRSSVPEEEEEKEEEDSYRLGCGGGNINSAQPSNEEICGTIRKKYAKNSYHMVCHHTLSKNGIISYQKIDISYPHVLFHT